MADSEFELIRRHFMVSGTRADVVLGIGDDCALLTVPAGRQLAVSLDLLVAGVHFLPDVAPEALGWKALAVNLSDLAAMGAEPAWATLGLTLPAASDAWLTGFCRGFFALAATHGVALVGGDTTRGPLTIAVQVHGFVPPGAALTRAGAQPGDLVCVSGTPGLAALGLDLRLGRTGLSGPLATQAIERLERPLPRVALGLALRGLANSCIDVSDGLAQDLGHILDASRVGACVEVERVPRPADVDGAAALAAALAGGDDYELCFTLPAARRPELEAAAAVGGCACTVIGRIEAEPGLRLQQADGSPYRLVRAGYDHFA